MRLKLDENLGARGTVLLRQAGHDVTTVHEQKLCASGDREVIAVCRSEQRHLVTLDLDFANPLVFPPSRYAGVAVLRLPRKPEPWDIINRIETLIRALAQDDIEAQLWIIQENRVRKYQDPRRE